MKKAESEVDKTLNTISKANQKALDTSLILPFSSDYQFCTNGVYFYVGKMGSGKTYGVIRHVMITDKMIPGGYYDNIVVSSTSGGMDKTVQTFMSQCKAPITGVDDVQLMAYLTRNVKQKAKYYAIMELVNSELQHVNQDMEAIIKKHHLRKPDGKFDLRKLTAYILHKLAKYPFSRYPSNTLLILDDYGGHRLLNKPDSPLANFITKVRHYNYTVIHCNHHVSNMETHLPKLEKALYRLRDFSGIL